MDSQRKRCLNCGSEVNDSFCPHCGQSTATGRLDFKLTAKESVSTLARVDRGFFYTAALLVSRPWLVIKDYIRGRRVPYTAPVRMLIVLCLFSLLGDSLLDTEGGHVVNQPFGYEWDSWPSAFDVVIRFYFDSMILQSLVVTIMAALAVYVVYLRYNSRRYNFAEYFTAAVYLCDAAIAANILLLPLSFVDGRLGSSLLFGWCAVIGILSVVRAFPIKNYGIALLTFILWSVLFILLIVLVHVIPLVFLSVVFEFNG